MNYKISRQTWLTLLLCLCTNNLKWSEYVSAYILLSEFKRIAMDQERIKQIVVETEAAAQKVLIDKEELIGLDFRRQKTREAYRALKNADKSNEKTWMSIGSLFIKVRSDKAQVLLQRGMNLNLYI